MEIYIIQFLPGKFSCAVCGIEGAELRIPARRSSQDILWWMQNVVTQALHEAHYKLSPKCRSTKCDNVMIPLMNEAQFIGDYGDGTVAPPDSELVKSVKKALE